MKKSYLILLIIIGLFSLALYSTYAMFTANVETDDFVNLSASSLPTETQIQEYERITINANDTKIIDFNINNNTTSNLYYGAWYEMVEPTSINDNIIIAKYIDSESETFGSINASSKKKVTLAVSNQTDSSIIINIGVAYSETNSLNLPTNRNIISGEYGKFNLTLMARNGSISGGNTLSNILPNSSFENSGWSGCSYNTTYKKYGSYSCSLTGTTSTPEVLATNNTAISLNNTHTYYSRVEGYQTSKTGSQGWQVYWPIAEPSFGSVEFKDINKWNIYSLIATRSSFANGNHQLRFDYDNRNNNGTVYYDGGMLLDLTNSYGTNIPDKETLDKIPYFEGTISYKAEEVTTKSKTYTITPNSSYEIDKVTCDNTNDITISGNNITINNITSDTVCEVDMKSTSAASMITELLSSNPTTMNNDDPDGNIRYMGADPNNYVSFNNELWRIIGVFDVKSSEEGQTEKRLKIIRNESLGNMQWGYNSPSSGMSLSNDDKYAIFLAVPEPSPYSNNDWATASLNTYLNGEYLNSLTSEAQSMIGNTLWNLGGTNSYQSSSNGLASHFYNYERGTTVYSGNPTTWVGKIALMYPSDYGYATSGGTTTNRASCLVKELYNWDNSSYSDCKNNDYLYDSSNSQWTLTSLTGRSDHVFHVLSTGYVGSNYASSSRASRPVLYLSSNVTIVGGNGTSSSPYVLS